MHALRSTEVQKNNMMWLAATQDSQAERKESLYLAALIITGNPDSAEQSIVDAGGLGESSSYEFRDWLVRWGRSATARVAVNAVRSSIEETVAQYADGECKHRAHPPLTPTQVQKLGELDAYEVIHQLDTLARATLVLYGCERASLSQCALVLNVPVKAVVAAYCRALEWFQKFAEVEKKLRYVKTSRLHLVRHDVDGVPVWG
jgi:hypothetical protein